jgi:hypothetical protein
MSREDFRASLEKSKSYSDLFVIVKRAVKKVLGRNRSGLLLYPGSRMFTLSALTVLVY